MSEGGGTGADDTAVVRDSQAAILASAGRITVVGRWVVLAAAVILNHFGNRNPAASVFIVDLILFTWALLNLHFSVLLVRGFRPVSCPGFLHPGIATPVAPRILYFSVVSGALPDFTIL